MNEFSYFDTLSENKKLQIVFNCAVPYFANAVNKQDALKFIGFISEKIEKLRLEDNGN